jgi:nitrogen fixation protein FixH
MKFHWGHGVIVAFLLFGALIISLVVGSMRQNIELVSPDYYAEEVRYQKRIDEMRNNNTDEKPANLELREDFILLEISQENAQGEVYFFRPSDSKSDFKLPLALKEGKQTFPLEGLEKGLWRVKVSWKSGEKDYFLEKKLDLK